MQNFVSKTTFSFKIFRNVFLRILINLVNQFKIFNNLHTLVFNKYIIKLTASTIHVCSRNDPDLPKCILSSVAHLQPKLASGRLADDFIIPALEPLLLDT